MMRILYSALISLACFSCQGYRQENTEKTEFHSVSVEDFTQVLTDTTVVLLDVRTAEEHAAGHIKGTKMQIDVLKPDFDSLVVANIQKGSTVALYCRSGNRSKRAAMSLTAKGYRVIELATGYNSWIQAGKPVE